MNNKKQDVNKRFWKKVNKLEEKDENCWIWTAKTNENGYGSFYMGENVSNMLAHRMSYVLTNGPIPEDLCVCHHCDNRLCVRPNHLFLGTKGDNNRDMVSKGRHFFQKNPEETQGEKHRYSKLTNEQVFEIRERAAKGEVQSRLAEQFNVTPTMISYIVRRKNWKHI